MSFLRKSHDVLILKNCKLTENKNKVVTSHQFYLRCLSGLLEGEEHYYKFSDSNPPKYSLSEIIKDSGQWFGVFESHDEKIICSDYHGYASLFYSCIKGIDGSDEVIISDSFRAICSYRYKMGLSSNLNWEVVLPHLITNTNLFLTRASQKTFNIDVNVINHDEVFFIKDRELSIVKRSNFYKSYNLTYDQLIDQGIDKVLNKFEKSLDAEKNVFLNLSGGKDSRVVLAMLLQSNRHKELKVMTANPFNLPAGASKDILWQDFHLASKIVSFYDLDWYKREGYSEYALNYIEQLDIWQDFRSNSSFELKVKKTQLKDCNEIRITGIGGELVRSYLGDSYKNNFPAWWKKVNENSCSTKEALELLFRQLCHPWLIDEDLYISARQTFVDSFMFDDSKNVLEQLDNSYLAYRNRAHSGIRDVHDFEGAALHYPLAQVEFFEASQLLNKEDRDNGKVLFDIISKTTPELNFLPFASPPWPSNFTDLASNGKGRKNLWNQVNPDNRIDEFKNLQNKLASRNYYARDVESFNIANASLDRLVRNIDIINSSQSNSFDFAKVLERIVRLQQKNLTMLNYFVAKTETIVDVILPSAVSMNIIRFDLKSESIKEMPVSLYETKSFYNILKEIDLSDVTVKLEYNLYEGKLELAYGNLPSNCSVAVYLYLNGKKEIVEWYEKISEKTINILTSSGDILRVMSFIKRDGEPEAQRIIDNEFHVN